MKTLLLKNANVVLVDREVQTSVLIEDGRIVSLDAFAGDEDVDRPVTTLLPGCIDVHIHGAAGIDVMDATVAGLREVSEYLASQGVTSWVPTFVPARDGDYPDT